MKRQQLPLYAVALAVLIAGLAFAGVPTGTLLILPLILACPIMMMFMMRGMDHGTAHPDSRDLKHTDLGSQPNDNLNRPGSEGGSQSMEDESYGSTEEGSR